MEINKDLIAASSTPIVLAILAEEDSYGYAILQRVRELSGGSMEWTDGMLYPVLHRLERLGYVEARWEVAESGRRRKYYGITTKGREQLAEERRQWQAVDATLRGIWRVIAPPMPGMQPAVQTTVRTRIHAAIAAAGHAVRPVFSPAAIGAAVHAAVGAVIHAVIYPAPSAPLPQGA